MYRVLISILFVFLIHPGADAQLRKKKDKKKEATKVVADTKPAKKKGKSITDITGKESEKYQGIITTYKNKNKLYFELPLGILEKEFLVVSRVAETPGIGYGGTKMNTQVIRWQRKYDKILLRSVSYQNTANDSLPIYQAVKSSNFEPIIKSFDIKAYGRDSASVLVEVTALFTGDTKPFTMSSSMRKTYQIKRLDASRSFIDYCRSYPRNVEVKALTTFFAGKPPQQSSTETISATFHHSIILLPDEPMQPRYFDNRLGYFSVGQQVFGESHQVDQKRYITRW